MTWEVIKESYARRSTQTRFKVVTEQLDFFSEEFRQALSDQDMDKYIAYKTGFAKELLHAVINDISINDLEQIVKVFGDELEWRRKK